MGFAGVWIDFLRHVPGHLQLGHGPHRPAGRLDGHGNGRPVQGTPRHLVAQPSDRRGARGIGWHLGVLAANHDPVWVHCGVGAQRRHGTSWLRRGPFSAALGARRKKRCQLGRGHGLCHPCRDGRTCLARPKGTAFDHSRHAHDDLFRAASRVCLPHCLCGARRNGGGVEPSRFVPVRSLPPEFRGHVGHGLGSASHAPGPRRAKRNRRRMARLPSPSDFFGGGEHASSRLRVPPLCWPSHLGAECGALGPRLPRVRFPGGATGHGPLRAA